jgi:hypothetical protein
MKRATVLRILKKAQPQLAVRYGVASLYLFGSTARDEARPESDVDLLVEFTQPVGLFQFIALKQDLEALLGRKVDLGTPRSLKTRLKEQVLQEAIRVG